MGDQQPVSTLKTRKRGLTNKTLESQRGQTDVTKSRQPWEWPNMVCEHICTSHLTHSWVAQLWWPLLRVPHPVSPCTFHSTSMGRLSSPAVQGACGQLPAKPPMSCPPQQGLAAALEHIGFTWRAQLSWARQRGQAHPSSATQHLLLGAATGSLHTWNGWIPSSIWENQRAEQFPAKVWAPHLSLALSLLLGSCPGMLAQSWYLPALGWGFWL